MSFKCAFFQLFDYLFAFFPYSCSDETDIVGNATNGGHCYSKFENLLKKCACVNDLKHSLLITF